jgi:hypothetical protein
LQYLYNTYLIPVSETKKEVSIQLTDDTDTISNDQYFDEIFTELSENNTIAAAQNEIKIQKLKTSEKTLYYYSAIDVQLSGEVFTHSIAAKHAGVFRLFLNPDHCDGFRTSDCGNPNFDTGAFCEQTCFGSFAGHCRCSKRYFGRKSGD